MSGLQDDLAYLREMAREDHAPVVRTGAIMVAAGLVFAMAALRAFVHAQGALPAYLGVLAPFDAIFLFLTCLTLIQRRWPEAPMTARSRGLVAALNSVGMAVVVVVAALAAAGRALNDPEMMKAFPAMLFVLYGSGWWVAFAVTRRPWTIAVFGGAIGFAMICATLAGRPEAWLALAAGLVLTVAAPGWLFARAERAG